MYLKGNVEENIYLLIYFLKKKEAPTVSRVEAHVAIDIEWTVDASLPMKQTA